MRKQVNTFLLAISIIFKILMAGYKVIGISDRVIKIKIIQYKYENITLINHSVNRDVAIFFKLYYYAAIAFHS